MTTYSAAETPASDLYDAVIERDFGRAQELLARGAHPDIIDSLGQTPLIVAARDKYPPPAALDPADRRGCLGALFPWRRTAKPPVLENMMARALLEAGADSGWRAFNDKTALMHAAASGSASACAELLAAGATTDLQNHKGSTALMHAAYSLSGDVLRQLIKGGSQMNLTDAEGRTALDFLGRRVRNRKAIKACRKLLKKAGAKAGTGTSPRRRGALRRHFTLDELTQSRRSPLKRRRFMVFAVLSSLVVGGLRLAGKVEPIVVGGLGLLLSLLAFPEILQLPYALLRGESPREVNTVPASDLDDQPPSKTGSDSIDYVSNFVRLGWKSLAKAARAGNEARLRHTWSYLMSVVVAVLIPVAFFQFAALGGKETQDFEGAAVVVLGPILILLVALALEGRLRAGRLKARQAEKDRQSAEITEFMEQKLERQTNDASDFVLYLRTFGVTGKLDVGGIDLETAMAYTLAPMVPVVALGKPGEAYGAGRILTTEDNWKAEVLRLIAKAALIMVIPSHREGTVWEISRLKETGLFAKTVFVMPPDVKLNGGMFSEMWEQAVEAALGLGLYLPTSYKKGLLFKLDAAGQLEQHAPFGADPFLQEILPASANDGEDDDDDFDLDVDADDGDGDGDGDGNGDSGDGGGNGGGNGGNGGNGG